MPDRTYRPGRRDPTRLATLRRRTVALARGRVRALVREVDVAADTTLAAFWGDEAGRLESLSRWLATATRRAFLAGNWWRVPLESAYTRGALRVHAKLSTRTRGRTAAKDAFLCLLLGPGEQGCSPSGPVANARPLRQRTWGLTRLRLLAQRFRQEVEGQADQTAQKALRAAADALAAGEEPRRVISRVTEALEAAKARLAALAQTELTRAHAEGELDACAAYGWDWVEVVAEWSGNRPCDRCTDADGEIYQIDDAYGVLPLHVGCRCSWEPTEDPDD